MPKTFGPWQTIWYWFNRWNSDGTLDQVLAHLQADCADAGEIDRELWCVDGTTVQAARCAAGGAKKTTREPADHALGRSRGGSTKIHLLCDRQGHPLHHCLTAGQAHESQSLETLLEGLKLCELDDEPVLFPLQPAGDKGYRADWIEEYLPGFGIEPVIPSKSNEDPEPLQVSLDAEAYRARNVVERLAPAAPDERRSQTKPSTTALTRPAIAKGGAHPRTACTSWCAVVGQGK